MGLVTVSTRALALLAVGAWAGGAMFVLLPLGFVVVVGVKEWRW